MKNKINHAIGKFFQKVSRWFFDRTLMACWHCGTLVGMNSTYTRGHMWCEPCLQRYVIPELRNAQQSRALDLGYCTCEKYCVGIYENLCGVCSLPPRPSQ